MEKEIVLATGSKFRLNIFKTLKIPFISRESNFYEYSKDRPKDPIKLVKHLGKNKVKTIEKNYKNKIIIGFDTIVYFKNKIYEKPKNKKDQKKRLKEFNGKEITEYVGYYILNQKNNKSIIGYSKTKIKLRNIKNKEMDFYIKNFDGYKFPTGFNMLEGYSLTFIEKINGDYTSFKDAIPFSKIIKSLEKIDYNLKL